MKKYILIIFGFLTVSFIAYCLFPIILYKNVNQPGRIYLEDRNGKVITDKANEFGYKQYFESDLNSEFVKDLLKIEDKNYYKHYGIDIFSKLGAIKTNFVSGKIVSGGSTITEQYIKNKFFINSKRTYLQKGREAFLAFYYSFNFLRNTLGDCDSHLGLKQKILKMYLSDIYFGNNLYGVGAAIDVYFGEDDLNNLSEEQIVLLISLLNNPGVKSIQEKSFSEYFDKVENKLGYDFERTIFKLNKKENIDKFPFVTNELNYGSDYKTTIDSELEQFTKDIVNQTLDGLKDENVTNAAVFAINPRMKETLIYQGSRDFYSDDIDGQVDVIKASRQPGSTIKPFLYLMALENGAGVNDFLADMESEYNSFVEGRTYISNNYSLKEYGLVRLKKALGNSLNNATVRLAKELGLENVYKFYKKYGFDLPENSEYYGYSLVLGNPSVTLKSMVLNYAKLLPYNYEYNPENYEVENLGIDDENKFLLYNILSDPDNRDISFGVNSILNTSIPQAVKTGTSSDFRDNLIISYHPDLVIGVWVGNNDNSSMKGVTGISGAGYIWHQVVEKAISLGYINNYTFEVPENITKSEYCLDEKCFRTELNYTKKDKKYYSSIADGNYSSKDIYETLNNGELKRLEDLGFYIK